MNLAETLNSSIMDENSVTWCSLKIYLEQEDSAWQHSEHYLKDIHIMHNC